VRESELAKLVMEKALAPIIKFLDFSQHDVDAERQNANPNQGTSCCMDFLTRAIILFFKGKLWEFMCLPRTLRKYLLKYVKAVDLQHETEGYVFSEHMQKECQALGFPIGCDVRDFLRAPSEPPLFVQKLSQNPSRALGITAICNSNTKSFGTQTGKSLCIGHHQHGYALLDSHDHETGDNETKGMLVATFPTAEEVERFVYEELLDMLGCSGSWLHVSMVSSMFKTEFEEIAGLAAPIIPSLDKMYDVASLQEFSVSIAEHCHQTGCSEKHDAWRGDALWFVAHQLRFTDLSPSLCFPQSSCGLLQRPFPRAQGPKRKLRQC
jgi:hypothetical protein